MTKIQIEKLFNKYKDKVKKIEAHKGFKEIIDLSNENLYTKSFLELDNGIEEKKILNIVRHKTNKYLYKFEFSTDENYSITITEDHGIMVLRDNEVIEVTPNEIKFNDMLIFLEDGNIKFTPNFSIVKLPKTTNYVYDIEVEDNHTFFANDILSHNSGYVSINRIGKKLLEKYKKDVNDLTEDEVIEITKKIISFVETKIQPIINETVDFLMDTFNLFEVGFMGAKVEKVMVSGLFVAKKKYAVAKTYDEGAYFGRPKIAVTGLEVVRSSTPEFAKEHLKTGLEMTLLKTEKDIQSYFKSVKKEYYEALEDPKKVPECSRISGVNSIDYEREGENFYKHENNKKLSAPMNSRAAILHNELIEKLKLTERYQRIENGSKLKFIYLKIPNPIGQNVIGFQDENFLIDADLVKYIDKDIQYEKIIEAPIKAILEPVGWELEKKASLGDIGFF